MPRYRAKIGLDETPVQKAGHKGRAVSHKQAPRRVFLAESVKRLELHAAPPAF